jgi:hypothetical protein
MSEDVKALFIAEACLGILSGFLGYLGRNIACYVLAFFAALVMLLIVYLIKNHSKIYEEN